MRLLPFEYAIRNLGRSPLRLAASLVGSALVVLLVLAAAGFVRGMSQSLAASVNPNNVILLGAGSEESVERSQIAGNTAGIVAAAVPGIRTRLDVPYVSPELHMAVVLKLDVADERERKATWRGVTPEAFLVHGQVRVVEGRAPQPGAYEVIAGRRAAARLEVPDQRLAVGQKLWFDEREWTIVGRFDAGASVTSAEIWCPLGELQIATRHRGLSCVVVTLDEGEFADVDAFCKQRLDLELTAIRERDYYARLNDFFGPIRAMVWATAGLVALGGLFGGLNTLYAAFASRVREMATLQTLGYSRGAILVSLVQESLLMAVIGGLAAAAAAVLLLDGMAVRISMGAFGLAIDAPALLSGLSAGLVLGIAGALPPAWRCLRLPIPDALRRA